MSKDFRKASEVVSALFSGIDPSSIAKANSFSRGWKESVGDRIASHSKVIDVDKGSIIVEVDHPGWSQEIQFRKDHIIRTLSSGFPEFGIKNLVIRVSSECKTPYARPKATVGEGIKRVEEDIPDVAISDTVSDDLKDVLSRLRDSIKKGKPRAGD